MHILDCYSITVQRNARATRTGTKLSFVRRRKEEFIVSLEGCEMKTDANGQ